MNLPRCAGILLHATSLPSRFGIGDFGPEALRFADQLACSGCSLWQVLPLGVIGRGNSPYQSFSAFAGEPLLISPEVLAEEGVLTARDLDTASKFSCGRADYERTREWKLPLLSKAYANFQRSRRRRQEHGFQQFCADHFSWLDDYALFVALKQHFGADRSWTDWDKEVVRRNPAVLARYREQLKDEIECQKYWQFLFFRQWRSLRQYCAERRIRIMGDIPIYVSHDSSDVWAHPRQFLLDAEGRPKAVSGVPPDYFSETGQLWGNPIYNWEEMERSGFEWWIDRFRAMFRLYDALRVDHFRGFEAYWEVPAGEETAVNGRWVKAPGDKLFHAVKSALGDIELIAENLGDITPEVEALRHRFNFPGMAILQFAFGIEGNAASYRPHNLEREVVAYTGTHDNDTVMGWWNSKAGDSTRTDDAIRKERDFALEYLGPGDEPINWKMIRALLMSVARVVIVPMQDILGLGSESRMNRPGVADGNWSWRMEPGVFTPELRSRLKQLATVYDRVPV
ncbi:MAG: 4-alpha-glucanotransferase [Acidobacteriaceae bacterium]|nr:4-alpha-glucanotransferase [Acidobacteriaceae bacterium]